MYGVIDSTNGVLIASYKDKEDAKERAAKENIEAETSAYIAIPI